MVTVDASTDPVIDDPVGALLHRVMTLREESAALLARVTAATQRSGELHDAGHRTCTHGAQVEQLQTALGALEEELNGLRTAMNTRAVIEQAKGMLMLHDHCDADAAFATLVQLSQTTHRKLIDVARMLIVTWQAGERGAS